MTTCRGFSAIGLEVAESMLANAGRQLAERFSVRMDKAAAQANIDARVLLLRLRLDLIDDLEREEKLLLNKSGSIYYRSHATHSSDTAPVAPCVPVEHVGSGGPDWPCRLDHLAGGDGQAPAPSGDPAEAGSLL